MPFEPEDAKRHTKKAKSPRKKRQFAKIANKLLAKGAPEGGAIRQASAAVAAPAKKAAGSPMDRYAAKRNKQLGKRSY